MVRPVSFFLLILFPLSVISQNLKEYYNKEGQYAFTPLKDWTVRTSGPESFVYAPADGEMDPWDEKLEFSVTDGEDIELEDAFDINTDFPAAYEQFKLIGQGEEEINGLTAKWVTFIFSAQETTADSTRSGNNTVSAMLQAVFYVIKKDNSLYLINGVTEKNLFPKFDLSFRTIIRTFRVRND